MTPFTAVFQYRRFFASPESGGKGGGRLYEISNLFNEQECLFTDQTKNVVLQRCSTVVVVY